MKTIMKIHVFLNMPSSFLNQSSQEHHELDRHSIHCHDTYLCIVLMNRLLGCNSSESGGRQRHRERLFTKIQTMGFK